MSGGFIRSSEVAFTEQEGRKNRRSKLLSFGVDYLDDAMDGFLPEDLVLVGARSGGGKTQFCCNLARANVELGKRVHFFALEAEQYEIQRRIKYQLFAKHFFADKDRPPISINYPKWSLGDFIDSCAKYEFLAAEEITEKYQNLFTYYKHGDFTAKTLVEKVILCSDDTDLIIVDHVHYFDLEDDNENRGIKDVVMTARDLAINHGKPIILVSHMRKRDRLNTSLVPGMEEFHGSSDLYKIATRAITLAPGNFTTNGEFETLFRAVKNRNDMSVERYIGSTKFLSREGKYAKEYRVGLANQGGDNGFEPLDTSALPAWARTRPRESGGHGIVDQRSPLTNFAPRRS